MATLKLRTLPNRAPVRMPVAVPPELPRVLGAYAAVYREIYGQNESVADLIPFIRQAFVDSGRDFARARRKIAST